MKISDTRLRNFRRVIAENKLRLSDIANLLGKAPAQVSAFGGRNPTKGIGDQIARELESVLDLHTGYLDIPYGFAASQSAEREGLAGRKLAVVGSVAAARWNSLHPDDVSTWLEAPGPVGPSAFVLRIEGVSMEPRFTEHDMVVIDPSLTAVAGDFVAVMKGTDQPVMLKQLRQEGAEQYLYTLNPDWPQRILKLDDTWDIIGRACWKITPL